MLGPLGVLVEQNGGISPKDKCLEDFSAQCVFFNFLRGVSFLQHFVAIYKKNNQVKIKQPHFCIL